MKLRNATAEYLDWAKIEVGHSTYSVDQRSCKIKLFIRFLEDRFEMNDPTVKAVELVHVRAFVKYLAEERGDCPKTVRGYVEALRSLHAYLREYGYVEDSPVHRVKLPKGNPPSRELISTEELIRMFEGTRLIRSRRRAAMARAFLAGMVYAGLRTRELLDLEVSDLVFENGGCIVQVKCGKGGKRRAVPTHREAVPYFREWLELRGEAKHNYLFAYDRNRPLGKYTIKSLWEEIKWFAGIDRPTLKPHSLRHNYATRHLGAGTNLHIIQQLLGHSSVTTTINYLHTDLNQLTEAAQNAGLR